MNKKVLVIDDDESSREVMGLYFTSMGFDVAQAKNGKEAIDLMKKEPFHLLFLDLAMPVMTGEELMIQMAQDPVLQKIPIIIDTAQGAGIGRLAKMEKQFEGKLRYLAFTRPGSVANLEEHVKKLLG